MYSGKGGVVTSGRQLGSASSERVAIAIGVMDSGDRPPQVVAVLGFPASHGRVCKSHVEFGKKASHFCRREPFGLRHLAGDTFQWPGGV